MCDANIMVLTSIYFYIIQFQNRCVKYRLSQFLLPYLPPPLKGRIIRRKRLITMVSVCVHACMGMCVCSPLSTFELMQAVTTMQQVNTYVIQERGQCQGILDTKMICGNRAWKNVQLLLKSYFCETFLACILMLIANELLEQDV